MTEDIEKDKASAPIHPIEVRISIGANGEQELDQLINDLIDALDKGIRNMASGGWKGSLSITTSCRDITAEAYRKELQDWSER